MRTKWWVCRQQALDWLRADLAASTCDAKNGNQNLQQAIPPRLAPWQQDTDLTALRDEKALAALPAKERAVWQQLWADVAALRKKVESSNCAWRAGQPRVQQTGVPQYL